MKCNPGRYYNVSEPELLAKEILPIRPRAWARRRASIFAKSISTMGQMRIDAAYHLIYDIDGFSAWVKKVREAGPWTGIS